MPDYDYDQLFPNRFLKAGLLQGKAVTLTIKDVVIEEMPDEKGKDGKKVKGVISFKERPLELVLNRTNGESLKAMFGRRTGAWIGKRVTIYPKLVEAFGTEELAIRVLGSPDIAADVQVDTKLGKRRMKVVLKKTTAKSKAAPPPEPEPEMEEESFDADTGEVMEAAP